MSIDDYTREHTGVCEECGRKGWMSDDHGGLCEECYEKEHAIDEEETEEVSTIKHEHKEVPPTHHFPDGDSIRYARHKDGFVYGGHINKKGKLVGKLFRYLGDTP